MNSREQCNVCKNFRPCEKGICCKRCNEKDCNARQCENRKAMKAAREAKLPWYLRDTPSTRKYYKR